MGVGLIWSWAMGLGSKVLGTKSSIMIDVVLGLMVVILVGFGYIKYEGMKTDIQQSKQTIVYQKSLISTANTQLDKLNILNSNNIKKLNEANSYYQSNLKLLQVKYLKDIQRTKTITIIKENIKNSPKTDDAPTAPILINTLNSIRALQEGTK